MKYFLHRLFYALPVIFGVCTLSFFLIHIIPGDPVDLMIGDQATAVDKDALKKSLGLDLPLMVQYKNYLINLVQFDLGESLHNKLPIRDILLERIPATVELTIAAMFIALLFGIPLGVFSAMKQYSHFDHSILIFGLLGMSVPNFFSAPLLIWIFSLQLDWLPVSDRGGIEHLILPALSLALPLGAILLRMTRTSMLEVIKEDYIQVAKAKGLGFFKIYFSHALFNALIPIISIVGLQVGALLTGTVITETIFDWPGIGSLLFQAIQQRDYPLVQSCILVISLTYVFVNLFTDLTYAAVNPKIRLGGGSGA